MNLSEAINKILLSSYFQNTCHISYKKQLLQMEKAFSDKIRNWGIVMFKINLSFKKITLSSNTVHMHLAIYAKSQQQPKDTSWWLSLQPYLSVNRQRL